MGTMMSAGPSRGGLAYNRLAVVMAMVAHSILVLIDKVIAHIIPVPVIVAVIIADSIPIVIHEAVVAAVPVPVGVRKAFSQVASARGAKLASVMRLRHK